jgi:hypothetical protein
LRIAVIVEGRTEQAFRGALIEFLRRRLNRESLPHLGFKPQSGRVPTGEALKRLVDNLCSNYDAVIALTDVYTGTTDFVDAADAKSKMRQWVGVNGKFYPHVALHDFESWLLPFWDTTIKRLAGTNRSAPAGLPETLNHNNPPAHRIKEAYRVGTCPRDYNKPRDAQIILRENDLAVAANACPELREFLNTILTLCGGDPLS